MIYNGTIKSPYRTFVDADRANFCRADRKGYLSDQTWTDRANDIGHVPTVAEAVAVAHEVGHVVQDQTGPYRRIMRAMSTLSPAAAGSLTAKLEAQADCYPGIWLHDQKGAYSSSDIQDAIESRRVGGDDYQQLKVHGYIDPAFISHGTSQCRIDWFRRGLTGGDPDECEIFDGMSL